MWTLAHPFRDPSNHQEPIHVGWVHMAWFCTIGRCGTSIGLSSFDLKCWKGGRADVTDTSECLERHSCRSNTWVLSPGGWVGWSSLVPILAWGSTPNFDTHPPLPRSKLGGSKDVNFSTSISWPIQPSGTNPCGMGSQGRCGTSIGLSSFDLKCWKGGRADVTQASVGCIMLAWV